MEKKEKQLLTIIMAEERGIVNLNGGRNKAKRMFFETAEGFNGQGWVMNERSLTASYPLNVPWYYDLEPLKYQGRPTWKFIPKKEDDLTPEDKAYRRQVIQAKQSVPPERAASPSPQPSDQDLCNTIVCATSYVAATLLAASGKEPVDEILLRAMEMKSDIEYMISAKSKVNTNKPTERVEKVDQPVEDDIPF